LGNAAALSINYKIKATIVLANENYCAFGCGGASKGICTTNFCHCKDEYIGNFCGLRANVIHFTKKLTFTSSAKSIRYFKVYNKDVKKGKLLYLKFNYESINNSYGQEPMLYFKDYIYGSGSVPNPYYSDFEYRIEPELQTTMSIKPNTVTFLFFADKYRKPQKNIILLCSQWQAATSRPTTPTK
jgi:hypothetical protein